LLLIAVALPFGVLLRSVPPVRERDLGRVYDTIRERSDADRLASWCGLRQTRATAAEVDEVTHIILTNGAPEFVCGSWGKDLLKNSSAVFDYPEHLRWTRLHHPTDPTQWIGIGVYEIHRTGGDPLHPIVLRVPVGIRAGRR
jgi:hypothetical protein